MKHKLFMSILLAGLGIGIFVVKTKLGVSNEDQVIYPQKTWGDFTEYKRLQMIVNGFAIQSMIDVPCLDFEKLNGELGIKRYFGITSSKDRAHALQAQYGSEGKTFFSFSIDVDILPKADLILCWDELCRFSSTRARSALFQFKKSGAKFLLMRHFPETKKNHKNKTEIFQPVNWILPPYNLPEPMIQIMEEGEYGMESLALWDLETL